MKELSLLERLKRYKEKKENPWDRYQAQGTIKAGESGPGPLAPKITRSLNNPALFDVGEGVCIRLVRNCQGVVIGLIDEGRNEE